MHDLARLHQKVINGKNFFKSVPLVTQCVGGLKSLVGLNSNTHNLKALTTEKKSRQKSI